MQSRRRKTLTLVAVAALGIGASWSLRRSLGIELDPRSLRDFVGELGALGPIVCVALIAFRSLLGIPSQVVLIGAGLCFGIFAGAIYGAIGLTLSAAGTFLIARYAGRDAVESRLPERFLPLFRNAGTRLGASFVGLGTAYPIGFITGYHALAGVTPMPLATFVVAVALGASVRAVTYTWFGSAIVEGGLIPLLQATAVLTAACVVPLLFPASRAWLRRLLLAG
jgi:uncharacterized membrane protein YdjX (TVP38/TMEM64 family)